MTQPGQTPARPPHQTVHLLVFSAPSKTPDLTSTPTVPPLPDGPRPIQPACFSGFDARDTAHIWSRASLPTPSLALCRGKSARFRKGVLSDARDSIAITRLVGGSDRSVSRAPRHLLPSTSPSCFLLAHPPRTQQKTTARQVAPSCRGWTPFLATPAPTSRSVGAFAV